MKEEDKKIETTKTEFIQLLSDSDVLSNDKFDKEYKDFFQKVRVGTYCYDIDLELDEANYCQSGL